LREYQKSQYDDDANVIKDKMAAITFGPNDYPTYSEYPYDRFPNITGDWSPMSRPTWEPTGMPTGRAGNSSNSSSSNATAEHAAAGATTAVGDTAGATTATHTAVQTHRVQQFLSASADPNCPGGNAKACVGLCPSNPADVFAACTASCGTRCL
jgi:hypothetical protein